MWISFLQANQKIIDKVKEKDDTLKDFETTQEGIKINYFEPFYSFSFSGVK